MIRSMILVAFALLLAPVQSARAQETGTDTRPALKAAATVAGAIVRIGDLVDNAGAVAEVPIFRAPDLGQTGTVPVASVLDAVRGHHLIGLDSRGLSEIAVTRAARSITQQEIEARILRALAGKYGLSDSTNLAVTLDSEVPALNVEATATAELAVARLAYDARTTRFDVTFELPGSAVARRLPLHFTGALSETFETAVPTHEIAQGQEIKASDLTIARRPKANASPSVLTTIAQVEGLAAKHALRPGQVIRQSDLSKPELVGRNESVTIVFEVPGITLSVVGKATEPGGLGDVINVLNVQSKHTIQATVTGPGRVSVRAASPRLAANSSADAIP
jgi:flagella basal body P-ring formation protein FlgA